MSMSITDFYAGAQCELYKHNITTLVPERHHVVPLSWWEAAGKLVDTPFKRLCPTCHMNVHWAMDRIIQFGPNMGLTDTTLVPRRALLLAETGIQLGLAAGLTPRRTL